MAFTQSNYPQCKTSYKTNIICELDLMWLNVPINYAALVFRLMNQRLISFSPFLPKRETTKDTFPYTQQKTPSVPFQFKHVRANRILEQKCY